MQRFVKTLHLVDDPQAIADYRRAHDEIWPEITDGIRSVGISAMDIYLLGNLAVMMMEAPDGLEVAE
ncbi:MAG: L-rhamnose mutarotase, partial [Muribaculaceae bacterium]|nr:L-rhamnose mutarotase [Muribaculaceae bacterium]